MILEARIINYKWEEKICSKEILQVLYVLFNWEIQCLNSAPTIKLIDSQNKNKNKNKNKTIKLIYIYIYMFSQLKKKMRTNKKKAVISKQIPRKTINPNFVCSLVK